MSLAKNIKQEFIDLDKHQVFHQTTPENYQAIRAGMIDSIARVLYNQNTAIPKIALKRKTARALQQAINKIKRQDASLKKDGALLFY